MKRWVMAMMVILLAGCAGINLPHFGSVADKYRQALANVDAFCKRYKMGPYLDRNNSESWRNAAATDCEILKVKPYDHAAVLATAEGKFAYSIQLPPPLDKPRVRRSDFRSAGDYFQALCEKESFETGFAKAIHGQGIVFLRAPYSPARYTLSSYSNEFALDGTPPDVEMALLTPNFPFAYIERRLTPKEQQQFTYANYMRFERDPLAPEKLIMHPVKEHSATYGYVVRGTQSFDDRDAGVWGGEALLIEIRTKAVIGAWRAFVKDEVNLRVTDRVEYAGIPCPGKGGRYYWNFIFSLLQHKGEK
jgi:hypothetical protein